MENRVGLAIDLANAGATDLGFVQASGHPVGIPTNSGQVTAFTTLAAVTGNATGTAMDCGSSHQVLTAVCVGTSTLAGTLTIEGSLDNTTFVSTGTTVALTAAATVTATSTGKAFRYYRVSLSGSSGAGTATCKIMANG